ncbi:NADH dehydrogenase [ubiquinone] 1 beta subcomplex subunit 3-like [Biomphalaria glabrata]|uniref:NADH dehydrogenase [ubiquinone] 1 beta subcomplex subunit 3 n=1 Tax=Biomphalaria glabrata TaxID=6526 RepID=A0A9W2Z5A9_BIOGL|nr:NADH dehydrogenase [ubiquinone] 1 beta subcomplex subunit 3-like [Biomphalaria glabrata]KAI8739001.1 dehydrogenase [ubiquinone] 1 beta subcomplex subunit 3 [Biomphalaria glabrata]
MGGGGGHAPHEVPDWKIYKAEGIPELDRLQKRLGALGLKDPWIRNEVWRFHPSVNGTTSWGIIALRRTFRGFGIAVAALAVTIAFDKLTNKGKTDDHGHH